jgi:ATP/maltotriose-dependent transcriptional regulator MalT
MTVTTENRTTAPAHWLAATKLHAPARRHDALLRPRLLGMLRNALEHSRLTLVSAPAGAGKTSLLAELPRAFPERKWAWLLLDEEDNDPSRFAAALAAALEQIDPGFGEGAPPARKEGEQAGRQAVTAIINHAVRSPGVQIVLAIDDFHVIGDEQVHQTVEYLIDRLPPNLRVIVGTREDPPIALSRWRARGELAEIRLSDLNFTEQETADLINSCLRLSLDPDRVHVLHSRTEGWAAGLRLLATTIAQSPAGSRAWLEHGMQGRQRVFEFLAEEVLDRQTPELRQFLLETSILSALSPAACDALTGRKDSREVLERLYGQNLYVAAADEAGTNYRYHDLFADFLRDRLHRERPEDWSRLHERAAVVETEPGRSIRHWMVAGKWEEAAGEIVRIGPEYIRLGFAVTLRRWILEIPEEMRRRHPRLALLLGTSIWVRAELSQAQAYFEEALDGFRRSADEAGQGESLVALSITAIMFSQPERARELFEEALGYPLPPASRLELHAAAGWDALNRRDWPAMHRSLDELLELLAEPAVASNPFALVLLIYGTSFPEFLDRLDRSMHRLHEQLSSASSFSPAYCLALRAACLQFRGDSAGARRTSEEALSLVHAAELPLIVRLSALVTQVMTAYGEGDWARADGAALQLIEEHSMAPFLRRWRPLAAYFRGRAQWLAGDLAGAAETYRQIESPEPEESPQSHVNRLLLAGIVRLGERLPARAQEAFQEALRLQEEYQVSAGSSSAAVLLAYVHLKRGRTEEAIEVFGPYLAKMEQLNGPGYLLRENPIVIPLLRLAHERGLRRAFVERVMELLRAPLNLAEEISGEALSERELEVLRVMAEGLGNRAIGERLFVSEATVKTHVQRILRKLDASSRTEAVARAREGMLL